MINTIYFMFADIEPSPSLLKKLYSHPFIFNTMRGYAVSVIVSDIYDFKQEIKDENGDYGVSDYINDYLGYYPQEQGGIVNYYWYVEFSYYNMFSPYMYTCKHGY